MYPYGVIEHNVSLYPVRVWYSDSIPTVYLCTTMRKQNERALKTLQPECAASDVSQPITGGYDHWYDCWFFYFLNVLGVCDVHHRSPPKRPKVTCVVGHITSSPCHCCGCIWIYQEEIICGPPVLFSQPQNFVLWCHL